MTRFICGLPDAFPPRLKKNAALLAAIWRWWSKTPSHRSQSPFLDIGFDEDKPHLTKVDVHGARAIGADRWEEILTLEIVRDFIQFLPVSGEEDASRARPVAYSNHVALHIGRSVKCRCEWLVISAMSRRNICDRSFMIAFQMLARTMQRVSWGSYQVVGTKDMVW